MKSFMMLRLKQRLFEKANSLTWLAALTVISIALMINTNDVSPIVYVLPVLFGLSFLLVFLTHSFAKFALAILGYILISIIISTCFGTAMSIDPTGVLSAVWFGVLFSSVFATLTLTYIIKTVENRHFLALKTTVINVLLVILSTYVFGSLISDSSNAASNIILMSIFGSFIITLIGTFIHLFLSSRAYKFSLGKNKILGNKFRNGDNETKEKLEEKFIKETKKAAEENGYTFKTYTTYKRKQGYLYKDNATLILLPIDIGFTKTKESLLKSAKVRKKTFDKVFYSLINRFSARGSLPNVPVLICFIIQDGGLDEIISYEIKSAEHPINVNFIPINELSSWLEDVEEETSDTVIVFPELSEKQHKNRDNSDFMSTIHPEPIAPLVTNEDSENSVNNNVVSDDKSNKVS